METKLLELVGLIYDAAQDPARWKEFLQRYASVMDCHIAQLELITPNSRTSVSASIGLSESDIREFTRFSPLNPWAPLCYSAPTGAVATSHELVMDADYLNGGYYHEFGRRIDQRYGLAGLVIRTSSVTSVIGAVRNKSAGPCTTRETDILLALMPHLARAMRMHSQFVQLNAQAESLMEAWIVWRPGSCCWMDVATCCPPIKPPSAWPRGAMVCICLSEAYGPAIWRSRPRCKN